MSCLQPCVHPQPSVCGEYDGKFTPPLFLLTQQTPAQVPDPMVRGALVVMHFSRYLCVNVNWFWWFGASLSV